MPGSSEPLLGDLLSEDLKTHVWSRSQNRGGYHRQWWGIFSNRHYADFARALTRICPLKPRRVYRFIIPGTRKQNDYPVLYPHGFMRFLPSPERTVTGSLPARLFLFGDMKSAQ
jgi:hypothetical protein